MTNPYGGESSFPPGLVSAAAVQQLASTKPWVRFVSVMTFIGAAFMLLVAVGMFFTSISMNSAGGSVMAKASSNNLLAGNLGLVGLGSFYVVSAFIYIYPGVKLWKYANCIGSLLQSGSEADLVAALKQQRSFWKFAGIMMIIMLVIFVIFIGFGVVAGIAVASHAR